MPANTSRRAICRELPAGWLCTDFAVGDRLRSETTRFLLQAGLIDVEVCPENRRRKRYSLTDRGRSFAPVLAAIGAWGLTHIKGTRSGPLVREAIERATQATKAGNRRPPG